MISEVVVRQLWDETPDAMLAVSADGQVVHWNRAAETIFGYSAKEAMGRRQGTSFDSLIHFACWLNMESTIWMNAS